MDMGVSYMYLVLVVEDDLVFLECLKRIVGWESLGLSVVAFAKDSAQGRQALEKNNIDLLLLDIEMPGEDGISLAIHAREVHPQCQIIFMSAYTDKAYYKSAIRLRAIEYIEKPVFPDELELALKRAVALLNEQPCVKQSGQSPTIQAVCDYLQVNYRSELSIAQLAQQVFLSPNYLSNLFKKETGSTVGEMLLKLRMDKAKHLLRSTQMTIAQIAAFVGYQDARHFAKLFAKLTGYTPSEYRKGAGEE